MPYKNSEDHRIAQKRRYDSHRINKPFLHRCTRAKSRASFLKVPFDLTPDYLESIWTGICPVSGVTLIWSTDRSNDYAAELDRFVPEKGYVKGNVTFLSRKINRLKNNATVSELKELIKWMENNESKLS